MNIFQKDRIIFSVLRQTKLPDQYFFTPNGRLTVIFNAQATKHRKTEKRKSAS